MIAAIALRQVTACQYGSALRCKIQCAQRRVYNLSYVFKRGVAGQPARLQPASAGRASSERRRAAHVAQLRTEHEPQVDGALAGAVGVQQVRDAERHEQHHLQRRRALQQPNPGRPPPLRRALQLAQPETPTRADSAVHNRNGSKQSSMMQRTPSMQPTLTLVKDQSLLVKHLDSDSLEITRDLLLNLQCLCFCIGRGHGACTRLDSRIRCCFRNPGLGSVQLTGAAFRHSRFHRNLHRNGTGSQLVHTNIRSSFHIQTRNQD